MRVNEEELSRLCIIYEYGLRNRATLDSAASLALDLRDARAEIARLRADGERLEKVRDLVFCYTDNESTDHPWWAVVRKSGIRSAICAGPFFSRERAEECCEARRHEWGKGAFVFGFSGYRSEHYKALRDLLDPDKKLRIKTAAREASDESK
ncbi:MAG: hypothetical protein ACK5X3_15210 [Pseudomonadota bacterium]|jgi:hypothetical protein